MERGITRKSYSIWWPTGEGFADTPDLAIDTPGAGGSGYCVSLRYAGAAGAHASIGVDLGTNHAPWLLKGVVDMSEADSMSFMVKGSGGPVRVIFHSALSAAWYDWQYLLGLPDAGWTRVTIRFPGDLVPLFADGETRPWLEQAGAMQAIVFDRAGADSSGAQLVSVDDVYFYR